MRFGRGRGAGRGMGGRSPLGGMFGGGRRRGRMPGGWKVRVLIFAGMAIFALITYFSQSSVNPITGETQRAGDPAQDVALGLQAAPEMAAQFGGPSRDRQAQARVARIGADLLRGMRQVYDLDSVPYEFSFTLLADGQTVNAFALPGGPTFITEALYRQLPADAEIAGVMGHEIGHVIHRHGAERMAKAKLQQGLTGAAVMATGDYSAGQIANVVGNFIQTSYGRDQEIESDVEGVHLTAAAGYDPRALIRVMEVLRDASGGAPRGPEWSSTHPAPENRIAKIEATIAELFPNGVPDNLRY